MAEQSLTPLLCPGCGGRVLDEGTWIYNGKFYCGQICCQRAALL